MIVEYSKYCGGRYMILGVALTLAGEALISLGLISVPSIMWKGMKKSWKATNEANYKMKILNDDDNEAENVKEEEAVEAFEKKYGEIIVRSDEAIQADDKKITNLENVVELIEGSDNDPKKMKAKVVKMRRTLEVEKDLINAYKAAELAPSFNESVQAKINAVKSKISRNKKSKTT